ncbi:MAG TPA: tagatose-6-phosphate ketose isomerase [Rhodanobacteraceae bacterium]
MSHSVNQPIVPFQSLRALRAVPAEIHQQLGCADTLREILQQPQTWRGTAAQLATADARDALIGSIAPAPSHIVLTGSGSSVYVGECLAPVLQSALGVPCRAIAAGTLLVERDSVLPRGQGLLISVARSGDSPESVGVVDAVLSAAPGYRHLVVSCNAEGKLATRYTHEPRVRVLLLDPATNDRSLVMTSSFTNLVLAGSGLLPTRPVAGGADVVEDMFDRCGDDLARCGAGHFDAVVYLGSGAAWGAARESALKMMEMSAGDVRVMAETSLGLRHGPMAWLNQPSLLVSFLSGDAGVRAYETDLLRELTRKRLGLDRIVVGENIDAELIGERGLAIDLQGLYKLPAAQQAMIHVVVGQILALFRCLALGQRPDAPSQGVLTRVVEAFTIHADAAT